MDTILVGVDGSASSRRALEWAVGVAHAHDAEVIALYVSSDVVAAAEKGFVSQSTAEEWAVSDREKGLEMLRSTLEEAGDVPDNVTVRLEVAAGYPPEVLIERSRQVSLLVLGARGLGPLRSLLGSVSRRCAEQAGCPVTIVRSETVAL
jgi:nucleotide-binding universal stress UspA family protein